MDKMSMFNLGDFKRWMKEQKDPEQIEMKKTIVGLKVESKISVKKLIIRISPQEGDAYDISHDFSKHGGIISEVNGIEFLITVDSGSFYIPKQYVKKV